jgi:hypothetical protein
MLTFIAQFVTAAGERRALRVHAATSTDVVLEILRRHGDACRIAVVRLPIPAVAFA